MPSKSAKQARLMRAAAHDKKFAEKVGVDQATAREYVAADKKDRRFTSNPKGKRKR